jgi:hypothetical protein
MGRLTEPRLQTLLREGNPVVIALGDGTGLSFRITRTETRVAGRWRLRYRHAGKAHWSTLGRYPKVSLKEAKKRATKERAAIAEGTHPVAERRRSKMALKAAKTFPELAEDYMPRALPDFAKNTLRDVRGFGWAFSGASMPASRILCCWRLPSSRVIGSPSATPTTRPSRISPQAARPERANRNRSSEAHGIAPSVSGRRSVD